MNVKEYIKKKISGTVQEHVGGARENHTALSG